MTRSEQATGRCTDCGAYPVRGGLVNVVETNSAPVWVNVVCALCTRDRLRFSSAPSGFYGRRG